MRLWGHGVRERFQIGPLAPGGDPSTTVLTVRRYLCRHCAAVIVVMPQAVLPRLRYTAVAVALALSLWAEGMAGWRVRAQTSPWRSSGGEREHGWRSLRRWARAAGEYWLLLHDGIAELGARARAAQAMAQLGARALTPTGSLPHDAPHAAHGS